MVINEEQNSILEAELKAQIKPLPENGFKRFFVKIYRRWLEVWYNFCDRHERASAILQKVFFFLMCSVSVTVLQYVLMTFLPYAFKGLNHGPWGWPNIPVAAAGGQPYMIFGDANGLGYFLSFEIAVFLAQCINFPLQRNLTYRSHGNIAVQALWYFIGWILVSLFTSVLWGICNCFLLYWRLPDAVIGIGKTMLTGIFSLAVFFFIFMIIFPDNVKLAKGARKKYERAVAKGKPAEKLEALRVRAEELERRARISEAESARYKATAQAGAAAMRYFALKQKKDERQEEFSKRKQAALENAISAVEKKKEALAEYESATQN